MLQNDILNALPQEAQDIVKIVELQDRFELTHPYMADMELFNRIREAIEGLGGKYGGYYSGMGHYHIPKVAISEPPKGVTPDSVLLDKSKPPELAIESPDTYKDAGNASPSPMETGVTLVKVDVLVQSPYWTRTIVEDEEFNELVQSIKSYGVMQNLLARWKNNRLELVYGHRRWLAAKKAGVTHVPVKVRKLSDEEVLLFQFEENEARKDLTDMEKARFLQNMMVTLGYTQEQLAKKLGKSQSWVSLHLQMLQLEKYYPGNKVEEKVHPGEPIETGELTERQARELLKAPEEKREEILKEASEKGEIPSARQIEQMVKPQVVQCAACPMKTLTPKTWRDHTLCPSCAAKAVDDPTGILKAIEHRKGGISRKLEPKQFKPQETWEHRKATMQVQHSKRELKIVKKLMNADLGPVITERFFCTEGTVPDAYLPKHKALVYVDGEVHEGKEDRDERLRQKAAERHGLRVIPVRLKNNSDKEAERGFKEIMEAL